MTDRRTQALDPGTLAVLEDGERRPLGLVTVNVNSRIIARVLDRDPVHGAVVLALETLNRPKPSLLKDKS